jgi:predicted transcriptional regulator
MSAKPMVSEAINRPSEVADIATFQPDIALLAALEEAEADVKARRLIPHAEVAQNLQQWLTH